MGYLIKKGEILLELGEIRDGADCYLPPIGRDQNNEMTDIVAKKDATVNYHEHLFGVETFMATEGAVEATVRGQKVVLLPGDMLHLCPFTPHGFRWLEEGTVWREVFHRLEMHRGLRTRRNLETYFPHKIEDPEYMSRIRLIGGTVSLPEPEPTKVDKRDLHEVRTPDFAFRCFTLGGVTFRQKVGRWETGGVKEIWEVGFEKGITLHATEEPDYSIGLFSIEKGSFSFTVGRETFTANAGDLVRIPEYTSYSLTSLTSGATFLDLNCEAYLLRALETLHALSIREPEKLKDKAFVKALLTKHDCFVTGYEREEIPAGE